MTSKAYVLFPPADPSFHNKVYSIKVDGVVVRKVVGAPKALRCSKWLKYSNFQSSVSITNVVTDVVIKTFGN